jgi:hypothetical protein
VRWTLAAGDNPCSVSASVSSTRTCGSGKEGENSSNVLEDPELDETDGERDGINEVKDIEQSDREADFDPVEGVLRRNGRLLLRFSPMIWGLSSDDIMYRARSTCGYTRR